MPQLVLGMLGHWDTTDVVHGVIRQVRCQVVKRLTTVGEVLRGLST
jgi:hypothetical protein